VLEVLRRRLFSFLLALGLALGAGSLYLVVAKPSYSATAQVLIDTKRSDSPGAQFAVVDTAVVESQIETIKTDKIAVAVIRKLALDEDPEFIEPGRIMRLLSMARLVELERPSTEQARLRTSMAKFRRALNVTRIGPSYLANIVFSSVDAEKAARIANEIADAYIEDQLSARALSAERANSWMQRRIAELRQQADSAIQAADSSSAEQQEQKQRLEAAAQTAKRAYDTFLSLTRYTQNTAERAFPVTEARIMSPALPPLTRTSPNAPAIAGVSLLVGCFLGVALALARERFDHSIRTREQLENDAGLRVLGFLPIIESCRAVARARLAVDLRHFSFSWPRKERLARIFDKRRGGAAGMLVGLKLVIDDSVESQSGKVIGITSPRAGDGKTTLAFKPGIVHCAEPQPRDPDRCKPAESLLGQATCSEEQAGDLGARERAAGQQTISDFAQVLRLRPARRSAGPRSGASGEHLGLWGDEGTARGAETRVRLRNRRSSSRTGLCRRKGVREPS
jgi:capsular polysaccharide biosynthesis protein